MSEILHRYLMSCHIRKEFTVALQVIYVPREEITCLRGFQPGLTQAGLYSHRRYNVVRGLNFWM